MSLVSQPAHLSLRAELTAVLPSLKARALKLCRSSTEAQDLLQDTLERALRFENSYQPGTNVRAWMHQILFSVFVTRCRRLRRERKALDVLCTDPNAWTQRESAPEMMALSPRVEHAVDSLPQHFRDVVRLVDLHEESYKDAAQKLGVPVGTVMSRLFRGRRLLAQALAPEAPAEPCREAA